MLMIINITPKEKKYLSKYSELMKLKLSMYYTPSQGKFKGIEILKDKYKYLDLSKIEEAINEVRGKVNKMEYLDTCLYYFSNQYFCNYEQSH